MKFLICFIPPKLISKQLFYLTLSTRADRTQLLIAPRQLVTIKSILHDGGRFTFIPLNNLNEINTRNIAASQRKELTRLNSLSGFNRPSQNIRHFKVKR